MLLHNRIKIGLPKREHFIPFQRLERLGTGDKVFCIGSGSIESLTKDIDDSQEFTFTDINEVTGSVETIELIDQTDFRAWQDRSVSLYLDSSVSVYAKHPESGSYSWIKADEVKVGYHCYTLGRDETPNIIVEATSTELTGSFWLDVQGIDHCFARSMKHGPPYLIRKI